MVAADVEAPLVINLEIKQIDRAGTRHRFNAFYSCEEFLMAVRYNSEQSLFRLPRRSSYQNSTCTFSVPYYSTAQSETDIRMRWCELNNALVCFRTGKAIGTRPLVFLLLSLTLCLVSSLGLLLWKEEVDDIQLFMPVDSHVRRDAAWVERNFRDEMRFESVIVEAENVLTPSVLASVSWERCSVSDKSS